MQKLVVISGFDGLGKTTARRWMQERFEEEGLRVTSRSTSDAIAEDLSAVLGDVVWERPLDPYIRKMFCDYADYRRSQYDAYFMEMNMQRLDSSADIAIVDGVRFSKEVRYFKPFMHIHLVRPEGLTCPEHARNYWDEEVPLLDLCDVVLQPLPSRSQVRLLAATIAGY